MYGFKEFYQFRTDGCSDQELIHLYLNNPKKKLSEICVLAGKSIGEIYRILHDYTVIPNRLRLNHQQVKDFSNFGLSIDKIADLTGYTSRNVRYILSKNKNGN